MPYLKAGYFIDEVYDQLERLVGERVVKDFYEKNLPFKADGFPKKLRISGVNPLLKVAWNIVTRGRPTRASLSLSKYILGKHLGNEVYEKSEKEDESEDVTVNYEGVRTKLEFNWPEMSQLQRDSLTQLLNEFHELTEKKVSEIFGELYLTLFHILKDLQASAQIQQLILLMYLAYFRDQELYINIKGVSESLIAAVVGDLNELFGQLNGLISDKEKPLHIIVNEDSIKAHTVLYECKPQPGFRITSISRKITEETKGKIPYMTKVFTDRRINYETLGTLFEQREEEELIEDQEFEAEEEITPETETGDTLESELSEEPEVSEESEAEEGDSETEPEVEVIESELEAISEDEEEMLGMPATSDEDVQTFMYNDPKQKASLYYFLRNVFRMSEFRPVQEVIMNQLLQELDVIGMLPAGTGKTLPYQLCGLLQPGVCVIVEPTHSLIKDHCDELLTNGIDNILSANSINSVDMCQDNLNTVLKSGYHFIYLTPDWLHKKDLRNILKKCKKFGVFFNYAIIDEVHCVSEWGHDFRHSYVEAARLLKRLCKPKNNDLVFYGLTALTPLDVLNDIYRELNISEESLISFPSEFIIPKELNIRILKLNSSLGETVINNPEARIQEIGTAKHHELINSLQNLPGELNQLKDDSKKSVPNDLFFEKDESGSYPNAGLIYCSTCSSGLKNGVIAVKESLESGLSQLDIATFIGNENPSALSEDQVSSAVYQEEFKKSNKNLMVATQDYGIGMDKPNIRYTYHYNFPDSIESFYQEIGRAGRNGEPALCNILYHPEDLRTNYERHDAEAERFSREKEIISSVLSEVYYGEGFNLNVITQKAKRKYPEIGKVELLDQKCLILLGANSKSVDEQIKIASIEMQGDLKLDAEFINNFDKAKSAEIGRFVIGLLEKESKDKKPLDWLNSRSGQGILPILKKKPEGSQSIRIGKGNNTEDILRTLYRLRVAGIIEDYIVDDNAGYIKVDFEAKKEQKYLKSLKSYLSRNLGKGSVDKWIKKAQSKDYDTTVEKVVYTLVEYTEQEIFEKRKLSIAHMKKLCEIGYEQGQDTFKERVIYYFTSKYMDEYYLLKDTEEGEVETSDIVKKYLSYINNPPDGQGGELTNARHLRAACENFRSIITKDNASINLLMAYSYLALEIQNDTDVESMLEQPLIKKAMELYTEGFKVLEAKEPWLHMVQLIDLFSTKVQDLNPAIKPLFVPLVDKVLIHRTASRLKKFLNKINSHE